MSTAWEKALADAEAALEEMTAALDRGDLAALASIDLAPPADLPPPTPDLAPRLQAMLARNRTLEHRMAEQHSRLADTLQNVAASSRAASSEPRYVDRVC